MGASATTTTQLPLLKRLWGNNVAEPLYKRSKFFAMAKKDTNFGGEGRYVVVTIAPTSGGSANFGDALNNQGATQEKRFFVQHRKEYQVFSIQGDLIARSRGDKNAVLNALEQQADKARYAFGRSMAQRAWGNGGGSLGRLDSTTTLTGTTLRLRTRSDFARVEPGMYLTFASDDGSSSTPAGTRDSSKQLQIILVARKAASGYAELTMSANLNTVAGITVNDYFHRGGDYALAMTGLPGWGPTAAPTGGESFMGLDRTVGDVERLSGTRVTGGGKPKEETIIDAAAEGHLVGIDGELVLWTHPLDFRDVVKEMGSKRFIDVKTDMASIGFRALEADGATGPIKIISEPDCPQGYFWLEDMAQIYFRSAGECPMLLNEDGAGKLLRASNDDAYQGRLGCYGNWFHENPGGQVIGSW